MKTKLGCELAETYLGRSFTSLAMFPNDKHCRNAAKTVTHFIGFLLFRPCLHEES